MANNLIQIKRSTTTAVPVSLANGEFAITSNGDVLYIGSNGAVLPIAGKRVPGTLTANQALVANSTSGIDKIIVANAAISQLNANSATGTAGQVLKSGGAGANSYWADLSSGVAGSDTQVQFNDGGNLAGDSGLTYNKTTDTLTAGNVVVSGTTASSNTTTGALKVAGGLGVAGRINTGDLAAGNDSVYSSMNGTNISTANVFATATVNASVLSVGGWVIANQSGVFTSGVVNGDIVQVGTAFRANTTQVTLGSGIGFSVNGSVGSAGQILYSNGTSSYWAAAPVGDITAVTAGNGLSGGGTSGDVTVSVLANSGLVSNSTGVHILTSGDTSLIANATGLYINDATLSIASSQITGDIALGSNTSGNYVATITAGNGISGSSSTEGGTPTIAVVANNGIVSNSSGVFAKAANGISVDSSGINVNGGSTLTVNSSGAHVNSTLSITSVTTSGDLTVNGNTKLGDTSSDVISMIAAVNTNIMPAANITYNIGNNTIRWNEIHASNVHSVTGYFDGNLNVSGDLIVTGNVTTTNVNSVVVSDPMIYLAGNNYASDLLDIGFAGNYNDGSTNRHTGFFRDATDGIWKLFANSTQELAGNNVVNTTATGYTTAILQAFLNSSGLVTNATHVAITANSTVNVTIAANTLTLSSPLATTSGGTGTGTYAVGDLLVGNSSNSLTKLSAGTDGYVLQINGTGVVAWNTLDGGTF